jgi:thioester reductase-like protein
MAYTLLTGVTGLLGRYLVRDLLQAGASVAVLVRPNRRQSGRQRVEGLMQTWEQRIGCTLPRPVVLEGDISESDLGLDARAQRWVAENCDSVIHNAASLEFVATSPESEPYRSNVGGTQHMLDLCQQAGIRKFHHVSTAYTCGLRSGVVYEHELDVGQELSNDYEKSKVQAEKLVRGAAFLDEVTVYRPAIIIGDSTDGYTTTYYGFYAPLQLLWTMLRQFTRNELGRVWSDSRFPTMGANDTKNLVPVDWVSAVTSHVFMRPEHHGKTYHLTPRHPITVRLLADVLEQATDFYGVSFKGQSSDDISNLGEYEKLFYETVKVYHSYWRNDPTFDFTNTRTAAPHLPCPHIDRNLLLKMCNWAIEAGFNSPRERPVDPEFDLQRAFEACGEGSVSASAQRDRKQSLALDVTGPGGGQWSLFVDEDRLVGLEPGFNGVALGRVRADSETITAVARQQLSYEAAVAAGKVTVIAGELPSPAVAKLFGAILQAAAATEPIAT